MFWNRTYQILDLLEVHHAKYTVVILWNFSQCRQKPVLDRRILNDVKDTGRPSGDEWIIRSEEQLYRIGLLLLKRKRCTGIEQNGVGWLLSTL